MFKPKLSQQEQGFTLVEVLAAIVIATVFVATALQAIVIAAIFQARAQESTDAATWIREDLENLRFSASTYVNLDRCYATGPNDGYADGFSDRLHNINPETLTSGSVPDSDTYTAPNDPESRTGKAFRFRRISIPLNTAPYAVLKVSYDVSPKLSSTTVGPSIATLQTEVIPNGAFECPAP